MTYIAAAELLVIVVLVVLNHRARNEEPKTLARFALMLEERGFKERVELLNAARNPGHVLHAEQPEPPERDPQEEERMRVYARNWDSVGRVVDFEVPE